MGPCSQRFLGREILLETGKNLEGCKFIPITVWPTSDTVRLRSAIRARAETPPPGVPETEEGMPTRLTKSSSDYA